MHASIAQHMPAITGICQRFHIQRLDVFGSAARGSDFNPEHSDADFLVEFDPHVHAGFRDYLGAKAALETILGRGVDLVESGSVKNPFILASINAHKETVYAA